MTALTATPPVLARAAARRPSRPVLGWATVGVLFYLRNEMCGEGTPYACPGPTIPVVTRDVPVDPVPMTQR